MNLEVYRNVLHPHQFEGLEKFVDWWQSLERFCHLSGCAGSGKTYSLKYYIQAIGLDINKGEIALAAPTNVAAKKLSDAFDNETLGKSIHRLYKIRPVKNTWNQNDQNELDRLQGEIDRAETLPIQEQEELQQQFAQLKRKAAAFAKNELFFAPAESFEKENKKLRLIIIDEGSMVDNEMIEWIRFYTPVHTKVIFLCDEEQIYPVKTGKLSQVFDTQKIANFSLSVRSEKGTSLHDLIETCRHVDFKTQIALLETLPEIDDIDDIVDGAACVVTGIRDAKKLIRTYAKQYRADGLEWRVLAYKNATVESYNRKAKFSTETKFLGAGDDMIVQSAITRGGFSPYWDGCRYFSVVDTGTMINLGRINNSFTLDVGFNDFKPMEFLEVNYVPDFYSYTIEEVGTHDIDCLRPEFQTIFNFSQWCNYIYDSKVKLVKQKVSSDYLDCFIIPHPDHVDEYNRLCDYFSKLSVSFYRATKSPETSDTIREFMTWFGEIMGLNLSTPKPLREWFKAKQGFDQKTNLVLVKNLIQKIGNTVSNIADDVRYPFASTLHKSQGQTIDRVILDLTDVKSIKHFSDETAMKRLLYTGISRASKNLVVLL